MIQINSPGKKKFTLKKQTKKNPTKIWVVCPQITGTSK